jgi:hypothetical protein
LKKVSTLAASEIEVLSNTLRSYAIDGLLTTDERKINQ